jgi:hypothetical protein
MYRYVKNRSIVKNRNPENKEHNAWLKATRHLSDESYQRISSEMAKPCSSIDNTEKVSDIALENARFSFPELNISKKAYKKRLEKCGLNPEWSIKVDEVDLSSSCSSSSNESNGKNTLTQSHTPKIAVRYRKVQYTPDSETDEKKCSCVFNEGNTVTEMCWACQILFYTQDGCWKNRYGTKPWSQYVECHCFKCSDTRVQKTENVVCMRSMLGEDNLLACACPECNSKYCDCVKRWKMYSCGKPECPNTVKYCKHDKMPGFLSCDATHCINIIPKTQAESLELDNQETTQV